ncbi:MAG: PspC domain-containing protein [Bacteroidetes bacterium]|nr:PspC domain-containing protein [Bacteroidota bacterium]
MKKTVNINISGFIFHIDEDAFEKLSNYIDSIKKGFINSEGRDEIIADIEARIAEMLQTKIGEHKQVINIQDIDEVISVMGEPEQIGAEGTDEKNERKTAKEHEARKRLYRDPDNKVIGGVCGGVGAYFNIDPIWIRVAFVIALFVFGSGPLLYLILWIIIPQASTTAEKLEMRGESVNISNIEKSIREEIDGLSKRLKNMKNEAKETYSKNIHKTQTSSEKFLDFLLIVGKYFIRAVAIFVGVVFTIVGIFLVTGLITSFIVSNDVVWISTIGISNFSIPVFLKLFISSPQQITLAMIGLALFVGIPLIMLVYNGIKLIFGLKFRKRIVGISSFTLWFAGLVLCLIVGLSILNSFSHKSIITKKNILNQPQNSILKVYIQDDSIIKSISDNETKFAIGQWNYISENNKTMRFGLPELIIKRSENENYQLLLECSSKGYDKKDAENNIKKLEYNFSQNDTALVLAPFYVLSKNEKWRNQKMRIIIKVPLWKGIYLSSETSSLLNYNQEVSDYDKDLSGKNWVMTENGLKEYYGITTTTNDTISNVKKETIVKR